MEKIFNYQLVLNLNENERIIFAGTTHLDPESLIDDCDECLSDDLHYYIENFSYIPKDFCENGKEKTT